MTEKNFNVEEYKTKKRAELDSKMFTENEIIDNKATVSGYSAVFLLV